MMKYWFVWALAALLVAGVQAGEKGKSEGKKKPAGFAAIDKDGDGKVSRKEYVNFQENRAEMAEKEFDADKAAAMFKKKDKDGDGFLSQSEMASAGAKKKSAKKESAADDQE